MNEEKFWFFTILFLTFISKQKILPPSLTAISLGFDHQSDP